SCGREQVVQLARGLRRIQPIGRERDEQRARFGALGRPHASEIEVRERSGEEQVGVRVEAVDELRRLVPEVALDREVSVVERVAVVVAILKSSTELLPER